MAQEEVNSGQYTVSSKDRKATVIAIAAIGKDRGLGRGNDLIFKIPEDMARFRSVTLGHPIITGRKNFESFPGGRPLPGRTNILVTRNPDYRPEGVTVAHSVEEAIAKARELDREKIYVIGGGEIYKAALPYTDELDLTVIDAVRPADTFFPDYSEFKNLVSEEKHEYEGISFAYTVRER